MIDNNNKDDSDIEFIVLKVYKSIIDKVINDLKETKRLNQDYSPNYDLILVRFRDMIIDLGSHEILKKAIISTDKTSVLGRDEL
ncbi:MAG TPA: hypothetical protein VE818_05315 [Nitrososphaeraceae archaeon]|nr:hypothetical protein [Nitrososphaeraceae archaeon]